MLPHPVPPSPAPALVRQAVERLTLAVTPYRLGAGAERVAVGVLVALFAGSLMLPRAAPAVPRRVVHVAGLGWVDAEAVVGLPATAGDGEAWALRRVDEAPSRGVELAPTEVTAAPSALALGARLSLNGATAEELEVLPGIGPALAARIVAARPFATVAALDRVRGIGPRTYARLAPLLDL